MDSAGEVTIVNTGCCHDCGGRCVLRAHVRDGRIIRIETDNGEDPQIRACLRGRAYRQRVYSPDRLQYPLIRSGERGSGKFERATWDEALDKVAAEMLRIRATYGNASILNVFGSGNQGLRHGTIAVGAMLGAFGGFTRTWGSPSNEGPLFASMATYGTINTGHSRSDMLNSRFIIIWGWDPANTVWDPGTGLMLARAREKGIPIVAIDPRFTDSAAVLADRWIPIRPGTDTAMLCAMAYVIITEGLHDAAFIEKHTVGFERYRDYLLGVEDTVPKTPEWAEAITTVPAKTIAELARQYATSKPAILFPGWGPARAAYGEQFSRAANVLAVITGNVGVSGGYSGGFQRAYSSRAGSASWSVANKRQSGVIDPGSVRSGGPLEAGAPPRKDALHKLRGGTNPNSNRVHFDKIFDAILRGKAGGYPADIKMIYVGAGNTVNQHANTRRGVEAFLSKSLELVVVQDQFMTPTAQLADVILPVCTKMERDDIAPPWLGSPYYIYLNKAIEPLYDTKTDPEICHELALKLGIPGGLGLGSDVEALRAMAAGRSDIKDFEAMRRDGVVKIHDLPPTISFREQIENPEENEFPTLSGKIEIYCEHIAEMNNPEIPPIPKYMRAPEGYDDPLTKDYPLQLLTAHPKVRTHSSLEKVPWLQEAEPHAVWINTSDAAARGIANGDLTDVFNGRGRIRIPARVTERIIPGTVCVCQGAWYQPDENGVDLGGCANVLTNDERSPGGASVLNTALVQVEPAPVPAGGAA